ncbi:MAG TPA: AAA family ATPase [Actinophytocola sp.]|jgi:DNA-binding SARP family transcriptional activator|uniref:ATP-binding protein n=1 Tax=Actinophytocola sp. TaxID=1872138 RepID=UPI002F947A8E
MLRIRLFGELSADLDGAPLRLPASRKACALLAWLALHPGGHGRSRLAATFWPDVPDSSARASLRSAIWALRAALDDAAEHLIATRDAVELRGATVDVHEFDALLAAGRYDRAERLGRAELLHHFDAEWVFDLREEYDARRAEVLAGLAGRAEADGELAAAAEWARRWAALRPLDETAARAVLRLLLATGERAAAVASYRRLAARLRAELAIDPAPETTSLVAPQLEPAAHAEPPAAEPDPGAPGLVGRDRELAGLIAAWRRAKAGAGRAVAVSGDGGIGKSRLAEELCDRATRDGALVEVGVAPGFGPSVPFGPWTELVAALAERVGPLPRDAAWPAELARVVRSVAAPGARPAGEPDFDRVRFYEAVVELVARAARAHPVLLVVEDLQLVDTSSVELTAHVGRRLARLPVLLVLTRRRLPPRPDVDGMLGALRARGALTADLELAPLPPNAVRRLVADLPEPRLAQVVAVAGGNPLIALETARAADPVTGLRGATRAATSRLHGPARLFVELLAAAGRDLDRAEVAALPLAGDPARAVTEALGSGLLRQRGEATGFRHALLSDAVYRDLAGPLRARLHGELADTFRRRPGRRLAAEIARHLRLAGRDDLAVTHLLTAAADARAMAALAEAAGFLTEVTQLDPDDADPVLELAEVQAWRGLAAESDAAFEEALTRIRRADTGALAGAWLRRGRWLRGGICHPRESRRSYRAALDVLEIDAPDPLARAEALAGMAWAEAISGDPAAVDPLLAEVRTIAEDGGDLLAHDVGIARGHALLRAGRFTDSYAPLDAAAAAANRSGRPDMAYSCLASAAGAAACAGEFETSLDFVERCLPLVVPTGLLRLGVYTHSARATVLRRLGRHDEAAAACDQAAALADRLGLAELEALVRYDRGMLAHGTGDWDTAARELGAAVEARAPVSLPLARIFRADALARAGRPDDADAELRATALEPVTAADFPQTLVARMSAVQARIAADRGDAELADTRYAEAEQAWRRCAERAADPGAGYVAALIDLGRPPISMFVEPERELAAVTAERGSRTHAELR